MSNKLPDKNLCESGNPVPVLLKIFILLDARLRGYDELRHRCLFFIPHFPIHNPHLNYPRMSRGSSIRWGGQKVTGF